MGTFLQDNPPRVTQFRARRAKPTGLIVLHTAEARPDEVGPDDGCTNVAKFIQGRTTPGCYHTLADSDSRLQLVPFELATFGDATGSNDIAIHLSVATQAARWATLPEEWVDGAVRQLAAAAADAAAWVKATHGIVVPPVRITKADSDAGRPGFIAHGDRDPARRTDPGARFPWADFLELFETMTLPAADAPKPRTRVERGKRQLRIALQSAEDRHLTDRARRIRSALRELPER